MKLEETKRVARILELVEMIGSAPRRYLRSDLAQHFEVSERMIQKDLEIIRHGLVLPLEHSAEGYYFSTIPRLPSLQYTFQEALALLLAVQAAQQVSGLGSVELAAAVARLEALFPAEFLPLLRQSLSGPEESARGGHRQQMLMLLNRALVERRKVRMVYETRSRAGATSERIVHPYHIMPYVRSWQLIAYCEHRGETLMFKVDRIREATLTTDRYAVPADFDVDQYMGGAWGLLRGSDEPPEDIVLHFDADAGNWVSEEHWHSSQEAEELDDGSVLFRLHIAITPEFVNWLLYYGSRVEVVVPLRLRERVAEEHRKAAEKNGTAVHVLPQFEQGG